MTIRQGNIQLGMFILLVDVLTDNWGSCPSPVLVHKVCTELQVGSTSSSSFFTEGWGEIKGTYSLTPPCPDLFKPVGPKPVKWTLWPSERCHQGIQGPTSSFLSGLVVAGHRWRFVQEPLRHGQVAHLQMLCLQHLALELSIVESSRVYGLPRKTEIKIGQKLYVISACVCQTARITKSAGLFYEQKRSPALKVGEKFKR